MPFSLVGGAGAGGAVKGLQDVLEQRFVEQKLAEQQRAQQAEEAIRRDALRQEEEQNRINRVMSLAQFQSIDQARKDATAERQANQQRLINKEDVDRQAKEAADRAAEAKDVQQRGEKLTDEQKKFERQKELARYEASLRPAPEAKAEQGMWVTHKDGTVEHVTQTAPGDIPYKDDGGGTGRGSAMMKQTMSDLESAQVMANSLITRGKNMGWGTTGPVQGPWTSLKGFFNANPDDVETFKADIGNLYSLLAHQRFGAALTGGEKIIANKFLPRDSDPDSRLRSKLSGLAKFTATKLKYLAAGDMHDLSKDAEWSKFMAGEAGLEDENPAAPAAPPAGGAKAPPSDAAKRAADLINKYGKR